MKVDPLFVTDQPAAALHCGWDGRDVAGESLVGVRDDNCAAGEVVAGPFPDSNQLRRRTSERIAKATDAVEDGHKFAAIDLQKLFSRRVSEAWTALVVESSLSPHRKIHNLNEPRVSMS